MPKIARNSSNHDRHEIYIDHISMIFKEKNFVGKISAEFEYIIIQFRFN